MNVELEYALNSSYVLAQCFLSFKCFSLFELHHLVYTS